MGKIQFVSHLAKSGTISDESAMLLYAAGEMADSPADTAIASNPDPDGGKPVTETLCETSHTETPDRLGSASSSVQQNSCARSTAASNPIPAV